MTVHNFLLPGAMRFSGTVLTACGLYGSYRLAPASRELRDLALAVTIGVSPFLILGSWLPLASADSLFVFVLWTLTFMALTAERQECCARSVASCGVSAVTCAMSWSSATALDSKPRVRAADHRLPDRGVIDCTNGGEVESAVLQRLDRYSMEPLSTKCCSSCRSIDRSRC
jgi:hypothetical protein